MKLMDVYNKLAGSPLSVKNKSYDMVRDIMLQVKLAESDMSATMFVEHWFAGDQQRALAWVKEARVLFKRYPGRSK